MTRMGPPTPTGWSSSPMETSSTSWPSRHQTWFWSAYGRWEPDMWKVTIKGLLAHKLRLMLTALAIILGVTFISGTFVLTDTLHNTFTTLFSNIYSKIDFQARGVAQFGKNTPNAVRDPIPQALLPAIRGVPGVAAADGTVSGYAQFVARDGKAITT